ncbi:MAG: hypothetical protein HYX59_14135 [Elusimicrobia bacterium]|nr:hypothetical protein [Elusimicrobiota bacterium]
MRFRKIVRDLASVFFLTAIVILVDHLYRHFSAQPSGPVSTVIKTLGIISAFAVGIVFNRYRMRRLEQSRKEDNDHG